MRQVLPSPQKACHEDEKEKSGASPKTRTKIENILKAQNYVWVCDQAGIDKCNTDADRCKAGVNIMLLLDRRQKWDCDAITESRSHYEFRNSFCAEAKDDYHNLFARKYPWACKKCREGEFAKCEWQECHTGSIP